MQADAVRMHEELTRAQRADEATEIATGDVLEERVDRTADTSWPRVLDVVHEWRSVRDESAMWRDCGYERVLSGHGPRSSSTYFCGSPP